MAAPKYKHTIKKISSPKNFLDALNLRPKKFTKEELAEMKKEIEILQDKITKKLRDPESQKKAALIIELLINIGKKER